MKLPRELVLAKRIADQRRVLRMKRREAVRVGQREAATWAQAEWKTDWRARRAS